MKIKSIRSLKNLKNKTVLVRADFDVPLKRNKIVDDSRLKTLLPTLNFLLNKQVKQIILIGHLGRPQGKIVRKLSLAPIVKYLNNKKFKVRFVKSLDNLLDKKLNNKLDDKIVVLENIRFLKREEKNCQRLAKKLAQLADIYVNECFSSAHRKHTSISAVQNFLPSYAGLHLEQEIINLWSVRDKFKKPLLLIVGGAKIETKLPVISNFLTKAKYILIAGAVANNFLLAEGEEVGDSLVNLKYLSVAKKILAKNKRQIILPVDYKKSRNKILDIGPKTILLFSDIIKSAKTIIWNGPLGNFENKDFSQGTLRVAKAVLKNKQAQILLGGGETSEAIKKIKISKNVFVSVGGGAMLEFLAGKKMPGLEKIVK